MIWKDPAENTKYRKHLAIQADADVGVQRALMEQCRDSILFWMNHFAWTFVVRKTGPDGKPLPASKILNHHPMITWLVQDDAILKLVHAIRNGIDVIIEKSRDMGASWLNVFVPLWFWLFYPDMLFLWVSRVEDLVDKRGSPDALFWKLDYAIRSLPEWMLPAPMVSLQPRGKFRAHMMLTNPENNSVIQGQATTGHVGRGGRANAVLFDEMAAIEQDEAAWRSAADTADCRIGNSTPIGPGTKFSQLWAQGIETGTPQVITLGYWDHPDKGRGRQWKYDEDGSVTGLSGRGYFDNAWFREECSRRDLQDLGQNILIDHVTSGQLFFPAPILTMHMRIHGRDNPARCELDSKGRFTLVPGGRWRVYCTVRKGMPQQHTNYAIGADISSGTGSSNSVLSVFDRSNGVQAAEFVDPRITPHELALEMCRAGRLTFPGQYGKAFLVWEVNGPGEALYRDVLDQRYYFVYFRRQEGTRGNKRSKAYGWRSSRQTKRILLAMISRDLMHFRAVIHSRECLAEALGYVYFKDGSIGPGTQEDLTSGARESHGDRVIAAGCALLGIREAPRFQQDEQDYPRGSLGALFDHKGVMTKSKNQPAYRRRS